MRSKGVRNVTNILRTIRFKNKLSEVIFDANGFSCSHGKHNFLKNGKSLLAKLLVLGDLLLSLANNDEMHHC